MIRVAEVRPDSIAAELGIEPGSVLLRANKRELRDGLDLLFYQADERIELEVEARDGSRVVYEIHKDPDGSLGIVPESDKIRRCTNACAFCFVKGNPRDRKLRAGLYIKDDDYRLSFLYGHYITLTNLREEDWERIFEQRLSPLYVSVHATLPDVRRRMLVNPRSAEILADLNRLEAGGIAYHAQIVLCPGLNDGPVLERTMADLYDRGDAVLSLSVVPVGLTAHNANRGVELLTPAACRAAISQIDRMRQRALRERGRGWCYAADELFLQAGEALPAAEYYDDLELVANGVGAVAHFRERFLRESSRLPRLDGKRIVLVTGTSLGPTLETLVQNLAARCGGEFAVASQENSLFGPLVTSAGLLPGADHQAALSPYADFDLALVSRFALNSEDRFLDDLSLEDLRRSFPKLSIWPSETVTDALLRT